MDAYHILERIGEGSFGKVYRGRRKYSGHIVALKFVTKRGKNAKDIENLREEVRSCVMPACLLLKLYNYHHAYAHHTILYNRSAFCGGWITATSSRCSTHSRPRANSAW